MSHRPHVRVISQSRPATAELQPIWEFIYIAEGLLGLLSIVIGQAGQILGIIQTIIGVFDPSKNQAQT